MPISQKFAHAVAEIIFDEIGAEKGGRLLDRLVNRAIIDRVPYSPKQSLLYVRNQFNLILVDWVDWRKSGGA